MMYAGGPISWLFKLSIPTSTKKSFYISTQEEMNKNIIWVRKTDLESEKLVYPYLHTREMSHYCFPRQGETKLCFSLPGETIVAHFSGV